MDKKTLCFCSGLRVAYATEVERCHMKLTTVQDNNATALSRQEVGRTDRVCHHRARYSELKSCQNDGETGLSILQTEAGVAGGALAF